MRSNEPSRPSKRDTGARSITITSPVRSPSTPCTMHSDSESLISSVARSPAFRANPLPTQMESWRWKEVASLAADDAVPESASKSTPISGTVRPATTA